MMTILSKLLLVTRCVDHCLRSGFIFAGLQYGVECFCGNHLPGDKSKAGRNLSLESVKMKFSLTQHMDKALVGPFSEYYANYRKISLTPLIDQ